MQHARASLRAALAIARELASLQLATPRPLGTARRAPVPPGWPRGGARLAAHVPDRLRPVTGAFSQMRAPWRCVA